MAWRYIMSRLNGDGTETFLDYEVPLSGVSMSEDLSGPGELTATITPEFKRLKAPDGRPVVDQYSTAVYAEESGMIRWGGFVVTPTADDQDLGITCTGFPGYLAGLPYLGDLYSRIGADPLDIARHIWSYAQNHPDGNIGLIPELTTSTVRIGTPKKTTEFTTGEGEDVAFESGPYELAWWLKQECGQEFDKLAEETPFEYLAVHEWTGPQQIRHRLRLGWPRIGARKPELRFAIGENVTAGGLTWAEDDYASEVVVFGAGEGATMVRGIAPATRPTGRLRRPVVVEMKALQSKAAAMKAAAIEMKYRSGDPEFATDLVVRNTKNAPFGSYAPGDEIRVLYGGGWNPPGEMWVRILSVAYSPEEDTATLSVTRAEKA